MKNLRRGYKEYFILGILFVILFRYIWNVIIDFKIQKFLERKWTVFFLFAIIFD